MEKRTRNETRYRNRKSKNGGFSPHLDSYLGTRITRYCSLTNQNKTAFVSRCLNECLDALESEYLESLTKEELIKLIIKEKSK